VGLGCGLIMMVSWKHCTCTDCVCGNATVSEAQVRLSDSRNMSILLHYCGPTRAASCVRPASQPGRSRHSSAAMWCGDTSGGSVSAGLALLPSDGGDTDSLRVSV